MVARVDIILAGIARVDDRLLVLVVQLAQVVGAILFVDDAGLLLLNALCDAAQLLVHHVVELLEVAVLLLRGLLAELLLVGVKPVFSVVELEHRLSEFITSASTA